VFFKVKISKNIWLKIGGFNHLFDFEPSSQSFSNHTNKMIEAYNTKGDLITVRIIKIVN
jgi:hypothetical protein